MTEKKLYFIYVLALAALFYCVLYVFFEDYAFYFATGVKFLILALIMCYFLVLLFYLAFNITPKSSSIVFRDFHKLKNEKGAWVVISLLAASLFYFFVSEMMQALKIRSLLHALGV